MSVPMVLAIASTAASVVGGFAQANAQAKAANAQAQANNESLRLAYAENTRQMNEVNRISTEQQSDRARAARRELSAIRAASAELGLSEASGTALVVESGYNEGVDIGRLDRNRLSEIAALNQASQSGFVKTRATNEQLAMGAKNAKRGALFNALGSGLSLGAKGYSQGWFDFDASDDVVETSVGTI